MQDKPKLNYFSMDVARDYGVDEAILHIHFAFWISKNRLNNKNNHDGFTWTYNTVERLSEYFTYYSVSQIGRITSSMVDQELIIKANYNKMPYDRTLWYALLDEEHWLKYYKPIERIAKWESENR